MSSELEQHLCTVLDRRPEQNASLQRETWDQVSGVLGRHRAPRRLVRQAVPVLGYAALIGLLALALPRGGTTPNTQPTGTNEVLQIAAADPATGLFDPTTSLAQLRGRVVVIGFVSRTCGTCARVFGDASTRWAGKASFVQVFPDLTRTQARSIGDGHNPAAGFEPGPTAIDPNRTLFTHFKVKSEPTVVVLDKNGREAGRFTDTAGTAAAALIGRLIKRPGPLGYPKPRTTQPSLSVLKLPSNMTEPLPPHLRGVLNDCQAIPGAMRLAATGPHGRRVWLAPTFDGGISIVISYGTSKLGGSTGCGVARYEADRLKALRRAEGSGIFDLESAVHPGGWGVAIVVLDGWTEMQIAGRRIPIPTNAAITTGTGAIPKLLTLSGPRGSRVVRVPG